MTEVLFYHLDRQPLERVLPELLERCLERGWRTVVQLGSDERCEAIDAHLWSYREEGFLPHGTAKDGRADRPAGMADHPRRQPQRRHRPLPRRRGRAARCRRLRPHRMLFDGNDNDAVDRARSAWKDAKAAGHEATYWQQSERGRWERKG